MKMITPTVPTEAGDHPLVNRILAQVGPVGRSSITLSLTGSLPEASEDGEVVRALDGEIAADLGAAAKDRLVDVGCRQDLVVEDDRERLVDILLRHPPETPCTGRVEDDVDVGRPSWS